MPDSPAYKVVNGMNTKGPLPYQVAIRVQSEARNLSTIWCGGTVIGAQYVLTAMHCLDQPEEDYVLIAGAHTVKDMFMGSVVGNIQVRLCYNN